MPWAVMRGQLRRHTCVRRGQRRPTIARAASVMLVRSRRREKRTGASAQMTPSIASVRAQWHDMSSTCRWWNEKGVKSVICGHHASDRRSKRDDRVPRTDAVCGVRRCQNGRKSYSSCESHTDTHTHSLSISLSLLLCVVCTRVLQRSGES